jgi:hypothetical protein
MIYDVRKKGRTETEAMSKAVETVGPEKGCFIH